MADTSTSDRAAGQRRLRRLGPLSLVVLVLCVGPFFFYCALIPATTGQSCLDWVSGHVPRQAEKLFLDRLFVAVQEGDTDWLSAATSSAALGELLSARSQITAAYTVIGGDDLAGLYERRIRFSNGTEAYLTFTGSWPCPDFVVTAEEVLERLELTQFEIE